MKFGCCFLDTSWPLLLAIPTTMQETLHASFAFLIASGIVRKRNWLTLAVIVVASLVRVTWALALIPWATLFIGHVARKRFVGILALAAGGVFILFLISRYLSSPYPGYAADFFSHLPFLVGVERDLSQYIVPNLVRFPFEKSFFLDEVQRVEVIALCVAGFVGTFYRQWVYLFLSVSLVCVLVPVAALYPVHAYRILYPHLLLASLVLLGLGRLELIKILIILHLALGLRFVDFFRDQHYARVRTPIPGALECNRYMQYDPTAPDAYANTFLIPIDAASNQWLSLPRGIGLSVVLGRYLPHHKSKYVFLLKSGPPVPGQSNTPGPAPEELKGMKLLCRTGPGDIYQKED
jgi:hypothetical protein